MSRTTNPSLLAHFAKLFVISTSAFLLQSCGGHGGGGGGGGGGTAGPNNVPRFAYVANKSDNTVSFFTVNPTTGQLRHNGYAVAGTAPISVTVDPAGKFAYVANQSSGDISAYTINANGTLTPVDCVGGATTCIGSNFKAETVPQSVTVDPTGKFAYVANQISNNVSAYTINATTGALTPVAGSPFTTGSAPVAITISPNGKYAYVVNSATVGGNSVSAYSVSATTGALTEIDQNGATAGTTVATGTTPISISVDPTSKFVYVANNNSNDISVYTIDLSSSALAGALTQVDCGGGAGCHGMNFIAGTNPQSITVDPKGKFVYVANVNSQDVSAYSLNATTGALTSLGPTVAAGTAPISVIADPSGKFIYVTNFSSNDVSTYSVDAVSGVLTALPTVRGRVGSMAMAMTHGTKTVVYKPTFAYVVNWYDPSIGNSVKAYTINASSGVLTSLGTAVLTGSDPIAIAIDPSGKFAYVANSLNGVGGNSVSAYTIAANGLLTEIDQNGAATGTTVAAGAQPSAVVVDPSNRFVYVPNYVDNSVSAYTINALTGALTEIDQNGGSAGTTVTTGSAPSSVAVDPTGRFAYVANFGSADISAYTISANGALKQINCGGGAGCNGANFVAGAWASSIAIDPTGKFIYLSNRSDGNVSAYSINASTGALTSLGVPVTTETGPVSVAVDPSGKYVYAANITASTISAFSIAANGTLTEIDQNGSATGTTVATAGQPNVITLDPSGRFAYTANEDPSNLSAYSIGASTGALTSLGSAVTVQGGPKSMTTTGTIQ